MAVLSFPDYYRVALFHLCNAITCQWASIHDNSNACAVARSETFRWEVNRHVAGDGSGHGRYLQLALLPTASLSGDVAKHWKQTREKKISTDGKAKKTDWTTWHPPFLSRQHLRKSAACKVDSCAPSSEGLTLSGTLVSFFPSSTASFCCWAEHRHMKF